MGLGATTEVGGDAVTGLAVDGMGEGAPALTSVLTSTLFFGVLGS